MAGVLEDPSCAQHVCVANPIVADFDADGQQEVAFTRWYDLWLLDFRECSIIDRYEFPLILSEDLGSSQPMP